MPQRSRRQIHSFQFGFRKPNDVERQEVMSSSDNDSEIAMDIESERNINEGKDSELMSRLEIDSIKELFAICKSKCGSRSLSSLIYLILRFCNHSWRFIDELLDRIGGQSCETAHKCSETFLTGDLQVFLNDGRGGKHQESFYDLFPELENEGYAFSVSRCSEKTSNFKVTELAQFIDQRFYETTDTRKLSIQPIRSEASCRLDIRRWGGVFEKNSQRPYFQGHERDDVVKHRSQFINHFLSRKDHYYTVSSGETPTWECPKANPCVVFCMPSQNHDLLKNNLTVFYSS